MEKRILLEGMQANYGIEIDGVSFGKCAVRFLVKDTMIYLELNHPKNPVKPIPFSEVYYFGYDDNMDEVLLFKYTIDTPDGKMCSYHELRLYPTE